MMIVNITLIVFFFIVAAMILFVYLAPKKVTQFALDSERKKAGLVCKNIDLKNGLKFSYLEGGQGEPLMLLHGFGGNKDTFVRVARYLIKDYRIIIPDIIGFGDSSHPQDADYSPFAQAQRLKEFCSALGVEKLHLAGNSMGAQIALIYSVEYTSTVNSLWLLSPAGVWSAPKTEILKEIIETDNNPLIARNISEFENVMGIGMRKKPFIPKPMLRVLAQERIQNSSLEERIFKQLLDCSVEKLIDGLNTKTLIVFGNKDRVISLDTADILCKLLPNSRKRIIKNIGHVPMFENPRICAKNYLEFRKTI